MRSVARRLRAHVLEALPPELRRSLRRARDRLQRIESRVRARLPEALGGRLAVESLGHRVLGPADFATLGVIRGVPPGGELVPIALDAGAVDPPGRFCAGIFIGDELVAAGWCLGVGSRVEAPFEHVLFAADFVKPARRRRGVAQQLHAVRLREAATRGAIAAFAWVHRENRAALAGFEASGFARVPTDDLPVRLHRVSPDHVLLSRRVAGG